MTAVVLTGVAVFIGAFVMAGNGGGARPSPVAIASPSNATSTAGPFTASPAEGSTGLGETPLPAPTDADDEPLPSFTLPPDTSTLPMNCDPATVAQASPQPRFTSAPDARLRLHVPVLEYHRIVPKAQAGSSVASLVVPPNVFDEQMAALAAAGWHTITAAKLGEGLRTGVTPEHKTVVITIDDGWWDGYTFALPILQKYGFVATYYVITGRLGQSDGMTADEWNALQAAGNEIGDHTVSHLPLARLSAASTREEIIRSAQKIAQVTGRWPETLAYPYGSYGPTTLDVIGSCHPFLMAVTTAQGALEQWALRFEVPRLKVTSGISGTALLKRLDPYR